MVVYAIIMMMSELYKILQVFDALLYMPLFICEGEANWHLERLIIKKLTIPSVIFIVSPIFFRSYVECAFKRERVSWRKENKPFLNGLRH